MKNMRIFEKLSDLPGEYDVFIQKQSKEISDEEKIETFRDYRNGCGNRTFDGCLRRILWLWQ